MKETMGIIYTSKDEFSMRELSSNRSVTAIPVAARYRLVDFQLSNLVNSGIRKVGVLIQGRYNSLMDHLGSGKEWNLHTRNNGLYILPPSHVGEAAGYQGVLDGLKANMDFLRRSSQDYVLICGGRMIYNTLYNDMIKCHEESGADMTLLYTRFDPVAFDFSTSSGDVRAFVSVDDESCITDMEINPNVISFHNILMDVVLIKRTLLMHLVDIAASRGYHELYESIIRPSIADRSMKVMGCEFKGYCRRMETINSFYNLNMDLLRPEVRQEIFGKNPVFTKTRDDAPAKYLPGAKVKNSLIADGCEIEGEVEDSVLFRGVKVCKGAKIKGAIIMQDGYIGEDAVLENVILDKDVTVLKGGKMTAPRHYPVVLGKNVTI
ncbi:MAG: glucose-1-phosphate adenylyltransferase subunit GlgD [Clostridia bacterium]|nr:glucose-1-phosphate adenylyltransferase subunit GlgD [Clostridia bacterium]